MTSTSNGRAERRHRRVHRVMCRSQKAVTDAATGMAEMWGAALSGRRRGRPPHLRVAARGPVGRSSSSTARWTPASRSSRCSARSPTRCSTRCASAERGRRARYRGRGGADLRAAVSGRPSAARSGRSSVTSVAWPGSRCGSSRRCRTSPIRTSVRSSAACTCPRCACSQAIADALDLSAESLLEQAGLVREHAGPGTGSRPRGETDGDRDGGTRRPCRPPALPGAEGGPDRRVPQLCGVHVRIPTSPRVSR